MNIAIFLSGAYTCSCEEYTNTATTKTERGSNMEPASLTQLEILRDMATDLVEACTDESLLDLICKLLALPAEG